MGTGCDPRSPCVPASPFHCRNHKWPRPVQVIQSATGDDPPRHEPTPTTGIKFGPRR